MSSAGPPNEFVGDPPHLALEAEDEVVCGRLTSGMEDEFVPLPLTPVPLGDQLVVAVAAVVERPMGGDRGRVRGLVQDQ